ncbi:hypothetical protein Tco_0030787 [Tanacetum coccineum]
MAAHSTYGSIELQANPTEVRGRNPYSEMCGQTISAAASNGFNQSLSRTNILPSCKEQTHRIAHNAYTSTKKSTLLNRGFSNSTVINILLDALLNSNDKIHELRSSGELFGQNTATRMFKKIIDEQVKVPSINTQTKAVLPPRNGYLRKGRKTKPKQQNRTRNGKAWKRQSQDKAQV